MPLLEVTSREFREKQKSFFERADQGDKIIIKRGKKQSYVLTPIDENDLYFTPEMLAKIDQSIQEIKEGQFTRVETKEELKKFLNGL